MKKYLSYVLLMASFSLILAGYFRGEVAVVLAKAIKICFECIGVG